MNAGKEVILLLLKDLVIVGNPGGNKFGNTAFDNGFGQFRIFQLVADGHPQTCLDQSWEVQVERMVRKTGQFDIGCGAVGPPGQHDAQDIRRP